MRSKFAMRVFHNSGGGPPPQSGANQWHSIRMLWSDTGQNVRNGTPEGSTGATRLGKKLKDGLFRDEITLADSIRRMPRVPGSCQSGRRLGVTMMECPLRYRAIVVPR